VSTGVLIEHKPKKVQHSTLYLVKGAEVRGRIKLLVIDV